MSWLGDNLDFELFNLKDMFGKIKENPEQLLLGAADPVGAGIWGGITGKEYEPVVNFLGGPMGGGTLGIGSGGVYDRAEAAGINTKPAMGAHDVAETVAAIWGGYGAAQGLGNAAGAIGQGGGGSGAAAPTGGGEAGGGMFGDMNWMDFMNQMPMGGMGGQQQPPPQPPPRMPTGSPGGGPPIQMADPRRPAFAPRAMPMGTLSDPDEEMMLRLGGLLDGT